MKRELADARAEIARYRGDSGIKVKMEIGDDGAPVSGKGKGRASSIVSTRGRTIARPPSHKPHPAPLPSPTDSARSSTSSRASPPHEYIHPIYRERAFDNRVNANLACPICPDPDPNCACRHVARPAPAAIICDFCSSPASDCICKPDISYMNFSPPTNTGVERRTGCRPKTVINPCGFCDDPANGAVCVCRIAHEEAGFDPTASSLSPPAISVSSLLTNYPPPEAAVKIRLRPRKDGVKAVPIFQIKAVSPPLGTDAQSHATATGAVCSGDPGNCDACRDDDFG